MKMRMPRPLTLFLLTAIFALVGLGVRVLAPAYRQQRAIRDLQRYGLLCDPRPVGPAWLRKIVGKERMLGFDDVAYANFRSDLGRLLRLEGAWNFRGDVDGPVIGDAGLKSVSSLVTLRKLYLRYTNVSDAGIEHVSRLPKLESLDLTGTDVPDASIPLFKRLTNLKKLWLRNTRVSDAGAEELEKAIPGLKVTR